MGHVLLEFLGGVLLARAVGLSGYGTYAVVMSLVMILGVPAALGMDRFLIREIAVQRVAQQWPIIRGLVRRSSQLVLLCAVAIGITVVIAANSITSMRASALGMTLSLGMLIVPCIAYSRLRQAVMQGLGHGAISQLPESVVQPLALLLMVILASVTHTAIDSVAAVVLHIASAILAAAAGQLLIRQIMPSSIQHAVSVYRTGDWVRSAMPFMGIAAMSIAMANIDVILVGGLAGTDAAAVYRVASQMAMLATLPVTAVNLAAAPKIAELYANGDTIALQALARRTAWIIFALSAFAALFLALVGPFALSLYGPEFATGATVLRVLLCGHVINAAMGVSGYILIMTRHDGIAALVFACAVAMQVVACYMLIPLWGSLGAAVASATSLALLSVTFSILVFRQHGIRSFVLAARDR